MFTIACTSRTRRGEERGGRRGRRGEREGGKGEGSTSKDECGGMPQVARTQHRAAPNQAYEREKRGGERAGEMV